MDISGFRQSDQIDDERNRSSSRIADTMRQGAYNLTNVGRGRVVPMGGGLSEEAGFNDVHKYDEAPNIFSDKDRDAALQTVDRSLKAGREDYSGDAPQRFADGGAVDDQDQGGFNPDVGATPDPAAAQQGASDVAGYFSDKAADSEGKFQAGNDSMRGGVKRFMAYLTGADAATPEEVQETEKEVDPDGTMDPADRKLAAIQKATDGDGGEKNGFRYIQHYRQKYDAFKSHAAAAIAAGDLTNAAKSATEAYTNLPDGYNIKFEPAGNQFNVTMSEGDKVVKQAVVSPQQMTQFLRGPRSQFDNLVSKGGINVLSDIAASGPREPRTVQQNGHIGSAPGAVPVRPQAGAAPEEERNVDTAAGIEAQARRIFPTVGQGQQREKWIAERLGASSEQKSALAVAKAGNETKERIAGGKNETARAVSLDKKESYANRYAVQAKDHLDQIKAKADAAARTGVGDAKERARLAVAAINSVVLGGDPDKIIDLARKFGFNAGEGQAAPATPAAPAAPAQASGPQTGQPPAGVKVRWGTNAQGQRVWQRVQ